MKVFRYLLPALMVCATMSKLSAEIDESDIQGVREFIEEKRSISIDDKGGDLSLSGAVRAEYKYLTSKRHGNKDRGTTSAKSTSSQHRSEMELDVQLQLFLDYRTENTWAHATLDFDQDMGLNKACTRYINLADQYNEDNSTNQQEQGSGDCTSVCLERAYLGMNVFDNGCLRADFEIGRWHFYDLFESRIQFGSNFDGILSRYSYLWEGIGDLYLTSGIFLVDSNYYHRGLVLELGLLNVADLGLDLKYSYTDWSKGGSSGHDGSDNIKNNKAFQYANSQFLVAYNVDPDWVGNNMRIYGAYLINHDAKRVEDFGDKADSAWYVGASYGKLRKKGDYFVDVNYQYVERQSIPHWDVIGIGRDDWRKNQGQAGYKGFLIELGYNITNNVNLVAEIECSSDTDKNFPFSHTSSDGNGGTDSFDTLGDHKYRKFEVEIKYLF